MSYLSAGVYASFIKLSYSIFLLEESRILIIFYRCLFFMVSIWLLYPFIMVILNLIKDSRERWIFSNSLKISFSMKVLK